MNKFLSGVLFLILIIFSDCDNLDNCSVKFVFRFNGVYNFDCVGAYDVKIGLATSAPKCEDGNFFRLSPVFLSSDEYRFDELYPDMTYYYKLTKSFNNTCDPVLGVPDDYVLTGTFSLINSREKTFMIIIP